MMNKWFWEKSPGDLIVFGNYPLRVGMLIQKYGIDEDYWWILIDGDLTPYPDWCMERFGA